MKKSEFLKALARRHPDLPAEETTRLANFVFSEIARQLSEGGRVEIRGFGAFMARRLNPRRARNPRNGEALEILSRRVPRFRAGVSLREKVALKPDAEKSP